MWHRSRDDEQLAIGEERLLGGLLFRNVERERGLGLRGGRGRLDFGDEEWRVVEVEFDLLFSARHGQPRVERGGIGLGLAGKVFGHAFL